MRGDFSAWNKDRSRNFRGTLHQQGRVLLDRDWNAQTEIIGEWQETAGRDAFGAGVAAVPAETPSGFRITKAEKIAATPTVPVHVNVSVGNGRVWADGLLVESGLNMIRTATYFNPPPGSAADVPAAGLRDAVILEAWLEELSPFQVPDQLLEPALGGVDTTERVQTAYRFRLYRMAAGETCDSVVPKLEDDLPYGGALTAKLNPPQNTDGDCPVVESGGYTGFEHRLYRVEIAETEKAGNWFKWSQFNGGLVGRGFFDAAGKKVVIKANENAIVHSGINSFYLEALELDQDLGTWRVIYGAKNVTLAADHTLTLPAAVADKFIGAIPSSPMGTEKIYFFRLWNGIERVTDFTAAAGTDLPDLVGIKLTFEAEAAVRYTPADFWTFQVRVGENPLTLIDNRRPQGIFYHRVPLAEIYWDANPAFGDKIEDCRRIFQPLTKLKTCCTYRVGDGINSHGDFNEIQDAINALPKDGGEVCILPGVYEENIVLKAPHNRGVILKGCGRRTVIRSKTDAPVIHVQYGQNITIESLAIEAHENNLGIFLEGEERAAQDGPAQKEKYLKDIVLSQLFVSAAKDSAIKGHIAQFLTLSNSVIRIKDVETQKPAVYLAGDDMQIERCEIRVLTTRGPAGPAAGGSPGNGNPSISAIAAPGDDEITNDPGFFIPASEAPGGLQIGGGSERVRIIDNLIVSGTGNGITLGSIDLLKLLDGGLRTSHDPFKGKLKLKGPCHPGGGHTDDDDETEDGEIPVAGPPLEDVLIKFNRIFNMGRNGIGVATFFSMGNRIDPAESQLVYAAASRGIISVIDLVIVENRIEQCMNISPQQIPGKMSGLMGYGGIALADTEGLVIRDNFIADNGPDYLEPICGIFVLKTEGLEISRNHILNNGMRTDAPLTGSSVGNGARGGIFIAQATTPAIGVKFTTTDATGTTHVDTLPFSSGEPAAKIQENVVTAPLGRSLTLFATGAVSVVGNQFTSSGIQPVLFDEIVTALLTSKGKFDQASVLQLLALLAGNILILDMGSPAFLPSSAAGFRYISGGEAGKNVNSMTSGSPAGLSQSGSNLNSSHGLAGRYNRFFDNGTVLFTNNQCRQNLLADESSYAAASIVILSLDDIGFHNNQCDCDFQRDFMLTNALLFGFMIRVSDNRFRETAARVLFSAVTLGLMNATTDNESIHCLIIAGAIYLDKYNLSFTDGINGDVTNPQAEHKCDRFNLFLRGFGQAGSSTGSSTGGLPPVTTIPNQPATASGTITTSGVQIPSGTLITSSGTMTTGSGVHIPSGTLITSSGTMTTGSGVQIPSGTVTTSGVPKPASGTVTPSGSKL